jgi:hypothetical protein
MTLMLRRTVWMRGLAIGLMFVGLFASPSQAADPAQTKQLARMAFGLIAAGVSPADAMDVVVNYRFCAGAPDYDAVKACMKPFLDKVGIRSIGDLDFYTSVIGHFSVYESVTKTTGGMDVIPNAGSNQSAGIRTDAQGRQVTFDFYYDTGDFVEFEYFTSSDSGHGYVYWVNNCMLVGDYKSVKLTDSFGSPVKGVIVLRRCGS